MMAACKAWRNAVDLRHTPSRGAHSLAPRPGPLVRLTFQIDAGVRGDESVVEPQASLLPDQSHNRPIPVQAKLVRVAGVGFPSPAIQVPGRRHCATR
jgi:hypothetical protein